MFTRGKYDEVPILQADWMPSKPTKMVGTVDEVHKKAKDMGAL